MPSPFLKWHAELHPSCATNRESSFLDVTPGNLPVTFSQPAKKQRASQRPAAAPKAILLGKRRSEWRTPRKNQPGCSENPFDISDEDCSQSWHPLNVSQVPQNVSPRGAF